MPKELTVNAEIAALTSAPRAVSEPPMLRRDAIKFKYDKADPDQYGMGSLSAAHLANPNGVQTSDKSQVYRSLQTAPTDSWEIDLCVGLALKLLVLPNMEAIQQLGRTLLILKVHKQPPVCEMFFMRHEDVVATYKERMPRALEWVSVYDPLGEVVFWAELVSAEHSTYTPACIMRGWCRIVAANSHRGDSLRLSLSLSRPPSLPLSRFGAPPPPAV